MKIQIIDVGLGNSGSICRMFENLGKDIILIKNKNRFSPEEKIVIPGVGKFDELVNRLDDVGLFEEIKKQKYNPHIHLLGICLGMQLLCRRSEEGLLPGLGLIEGEVRKFDFKEIKLRIPHMGWNNVKVRNINPLFKGGKETRFYFVHSYHAICDHGEDVFLTTNYGYDFASGIYSKNIYGVQFHPEKSHKFGMQLLKNFAEL